MGLQGTLVAVSGLCEADKTRMFDLMSRHFEGLQPAAFLRDLDEKEWAIVLIDGASGRIVGFSTQVLMNTSLQGERIRALFSGDTIIDKQHWGDTELIRVWGRMALDLIDRYGGEPLYWFLISMGYKTYRFLPVFFSEFYPRFDRATPRREQQVLDALATERYPAEYDVAHGVVRPCGKVRLRPGVADVDERRRKDPHVRFFLERNPDHAQGVELACVAPLTRENLKPRAYAIVHAKDAVQGAGVAGMEGGRA
jgi:hypothetical protein